LYRGGGLQVKMSQPGIKEKKKKPIAGKAGQIPKAHETNKLTKERNLKAR